MRRPLIALVLLALFVAPATGWAQAARAAATSADLPEPSLSELMESIPPAPVVVFALDHEQLAAMAASSVPTRGQDALVAETFRTLAGMIWSQEGAEDTGLDLPLASASTVGFYPPDGQMVVVTSRRALRSRLGDGADPVSIGDAWRRMMGARRGDRVIVASDQRIESALESDRVSWDLTADWPTVGDAWSDDAALRVYVDAAELVRTSPYPSRAMRWFRDNGIRRVAIAVHPDASVHVAIDGTDPSVMSRALGAVALSTRAGLEEAIGVEPMRDVLLLALDGILSRVTLDTTSTPMRATVAAPTCGGILQQMTSAGFLAMVAERGVRGDLPAVTPFVGIETPPVLDHCPPRSERSPAGLAVDLLPLLEVDAAGAVVATADLSAIARAVFVDGGGLLPFALDPARVDAVMADHGIALAEPMGVTGVALGDRADGGADGAWVRLERALDAQLSPLHLRNSTATESARYFASDPADLPAVGPDIEPPAWLALVDRAMPGVVAISPSVFDELSSELPSALRGPWVQVFAASDAVLVSVDGDGRPTVTIATPDATDEAATRLADVFTTALQGMLQLMAVEMDLGPRGVQMVTDLGGRIGALGSGERVEGGLRYTLDVDGEWIALAVVGMLSTQLTWLHEEYYESARWLVEDGMREIIQGARSYWDNEADDAGVRRFPASVGPTPDLATLTERCAVVPSGRQGWSVALPDPPDGTPELADDANSWERLRFEPEHLDWVAWSFSSSGTDNTARMEVTAFVDADCDGEFAEYTWVSDPAWHGTPRPWPGSDEAPFEVERPLE